MPESGAQPNVPPRPAPRTARRPRVLRPLLPDDYLELINPLWSTRELRGRIERIDAETEDAATVVIKPATAWDGHKPGQYLRIGIDIEGRRHWRAYSLTSDPDDEDGFISITVKNVDEGTVSPYLTQARPARDDRRPRRRRGRLRAARGAAREAAVHQRRQRDHADHVMLRSLDHHDEMNDVVLIHSARDEDDVIFGDQLRELAKKHDGFKLHEQHTEENGRFEPASTSTSSARTGRSARRSSRARADARRRRGALRRARLLRPALHGALPAQARHRAETGEGGTIIFTESDCEAICDGETPIMVAGEEEGLDMPYGCREGICHTCVLTLKTGQVRDLRNGKVYGNEGETIRTCINAPEGNIEIEF